MFTTDLDTEILNDSILSSGNSWGPEDDNWDDEEDEISSN